ncbi:Translocation and assembly module TamA [invertebrate metagenome]|uniref:Translocation and assembly module subunit TamA n=1 Tax=invertebrate metagenome TaxID=1711999 RepID=A0A2H9TCC8_9ZZZZ
MKQKGSAIRLLVWVGLLIVEMSKSLATEIRYDITGIDGDVKGNVRYFLDSLPDYKPENFKRFQPYVRETIQKAMQALGYYSASVKLVMQDAHEVMVHIKSGRPVKLDSIYVAIDGMAKSDPAFQHYMSSLPLSSGDLVNHEKYEEIKKKLCQLGQDHGYFDARFIRHRLVIDPENYRGSVDILFDSGSRYRFGKIKYTHLSPGLQRLIRPLVDFREGDFYDINCLNQLTQRLSATGYFRSIDIYPLKDEASDAVIPLHIGLRTRQAHELELGVGLSTDEGLHTRLDWKKPLINDKGHSMTARVGVSEIKQELSASYKIPIDNPLQRYYVVETAYERLNQKDTDSKLLRTSFHKMRIQPEGWDRDLFFSVEYESYEQGIQQDKSLLLLPGISLSRRVTDGRYDPDQGYYQLIKLQASSKQWGSNADFIQLSGRIKGLYTFAEKHRLIGRLEQGITWVDSLDVIPPSLRFFAGGNQSVRGYGYESISPKDSEGNLTGSKYLSVVSAEYSYTFRPKWRAALFVDTGTATNDYHESWKVGTGFGLRWVSPIGQVRLDLAFAMSEEGHPWRIHFGIGPEI